MKYTNCLVLPATRLRVLAATIAIAPLSLFAAIDPVSYLGTAVVDPIAPVGNAYPPGWFGASVSASNVATNLPLVSYATPLNDTNPPTIATPGAGLYSVSGLTQVGSGGSTGIGSISANGTNNFIFRQFRNDLPAYTFSGMRISYTTEVFKSFASPQFIDGLRLQYYIGGLLSPTVGSELTTLTGNGAGSGWSDFAPGLDDYYVTGATLHGSHQIPLTDLSFTGANSGDSTWNPGQYLYLRWFDQATGTVSQNVGTALNQLSITGLPEFPGFVAVPEPSTWLAAGLLLGCVGFNSRRRKAVVTA